MPSKLREKFDRKFDHFNCDYFGTGGSGKQICNGDCSKAYNLEDVFNFISSEFSSLLDKIEIMIAEEMNTATSEGQPTSRLTSLAVKITKLKTS